MDAEAKEAQGGTHSQVPNVIVARISKLSWSVARLRGLDVMVVRAFNYNQANRPAVPRTYPSAALEAAVPRTRDEQVGRRGEKRDTIRRFQTSQKPGSPVWVSAFQGRGKLIQRRCDQVAKVPCVIASPARQDPGCGTIVGGGTGYPSDMLLQPRNGM
ncbi:hypothetical protein CMUS01_06290 [Colletotrichum musicola]|uniref:Uncharacterized protein n=1 Tax=Colletotrichum musicola TaxID=2175873 RepID=A0A8H6NIH4_9PEZI|nr:hypothetical protein CMUS01_06290 [Colletotrichum musicola]